MIDPKERITGLLIAAEKSGGSLRPSAGDLMPLVYEELRRIANRCMSSARGSVTLQPTAVVHEAYLRLVDQTRVDWKGRTHFLAVGAMMIRRVLVDHARERKRLKRGGEWEQVTIQGPEGPAGQGPLLLEQFIDLDAALSRLAGLDPLQAEIVELRFFTGLSEEEIARHLGVSLRTVSGYWSHARAWLRREMAGDRLK